WFKADNKIRPPLGGLILLTSAPFRRLSPALVLDGVSSLTGQNHYAIIPGVIISNYCYRN
ncbi:hypothetical protein, partial [Obesumbacterium proteus]|uniref:hypothetical protein n=1 Tax=Obesumbacterium proteus TaxID=82983 RepID=UPI001F2002B2